MSDQAKVLRGLMERRQIAAIEPIVAASKTAQTIAVTSGKGGVGKSNIALNLAVALAQQGASVGLLDANMGLGNIDLLCGLNGYWNLSHVISGARDLKDVILRGPAGVNVIPGASGLAEVADCPEAAQRELLRQLGELEQTHDFLIVDTGTGIHRTVRQFVTPADVVLIVTTPEPTSIADAYATIKALSACEVDRLETIVNQADSHHQARAILGRLQQTSRMFLKRDVIAAGSIPRDPSVARAVVARRPFLQEFPNCAATKAVQQLAGRLKNLAEGQPARGDFFTRLWHRFCRAA